jgi:hypothetical protein
MKQSYLIAAAASIPAVLIVSWFAVPLISVLLFPPKPQPEVVRNEPEPQPTPQPVSTDPYREITSLELTSCWMFLRDSAKDPRSFRVLNKTPANGGIVEFTATNSFGGPARHTYRCTTGQLQ